MKVLHVNAGLENGGGLSHIVNLLTEAKQEGKVLLRRQHVNTGLRLMFWAQIAVMI